MKIRSVTSKLLLFLPAFFTIQAGFLFAETKGSNPFTMASVYIDEGNKLIQSDPAKAERLYREALGRCPESVNASFNLGVSLYSQDKIGEAVNLFKEIVDKYPTRTDALRMLAYILVKENIDSEKGMALAEKILAADSKDEGARKILTIALTVPLPAPVPPQPDKTVAKLSQPEGSHSTQKVKLEETVSPLLKEGRLANKRGDIEAAIVSFRKVLNIEPDNREAREYIGKMDTKKTRDTVEKEIEKHYLNGVGLYIDGKYREAIDSWKKVLEIDPKNEKASLNIEKCKRKMEGVMNTK